MCFLVCLVPWRRMTLRFMHIVAGGSVRIFALRRSMLLYGSTTIHSFTHLGMHFCSVSSLVPLQINMLWALGYKPLNRHGGKYSGVECWIMVDVSLFKGPENFLKLAAPLYIPASRIQEFYFLHILVNTWWSLFNVRHSNGCVVVSYYGFNWHFPNY